MKRTEDRDIPAWGASARRLARQCSHVFGFLLILGWVIRGIGAVFDTSIRDSWVIWLLIGPSLAALAVATVAGATWLVAEFVAGLRTPRETRARLRGQ